MFLRQMVISEDKPKISYNSMVDGIAACGESMPTIIEHCPITKCI